MSNLILTLIISLVTLFTFPDQIKEKVEQPRNKKGQFKSKFESSNDPDIIKVDLDAPPPLPKQKEEVVKEQKENVEEVNEVVEEKVEEPVEQPVLQEVTEDEKEKFKIPNKEGEYYSHKRDMTTKKNFGKDHMEALDYVGFFEKE